MIVLHHRVRYHEADAQGFLFNARYLELADVAMTEFFRRLGWNYDDLVSGGTDPSVVSATLAFTTPARFEDVLDVDVECSRVGHSSFDLDMTVLRGETVIASVSLVYVNVDPATVRSHALPETVAAGLRGITSPE